MTEPGIPKYSDSELSAMGFCRLEARDSSCPRCGRTVECWEDRAGNKCPFIRDAVAPGEAPRVMSHYLLCGHKVYFGRPAAVRRTTGDT
jgi:hypothetical protein